MAINVPDPRRPWPWKFATAFQLDGPEGHFFKRIGKALMWELVRKACGRCHSEFFWKERAEELNHFNEGCKFQKFNQFLHLGTQAEDPGSKRKKSGRKMEQLTGFWCSLLCQCQALSFPQYSCEFSSHFLPGVFLCVWGWGMSLPMDQQYQVPTLHHVSHIYTLK